MVFVLEDTSIVERLFDGWQETLIYSCLQKVMGKVFVTDPDEPESAYAFVGCFGFFAGKPDRELAENIPMGFSILVPQNEAWEELIEAVYPEAKKVTRYAIQRRDRDRRRYRGARTQKTPCADRMLGADLKMPERGIVSQLGRPKHGLRASRGEAGV